MQERDTATTLEAVQRREAQHFLPVARRLPVAIARGSGSRVWDVAGNELVDLTAGWGVNAIGHCHPALVEAISSQAGQLMQTTNFMYSLPQLDLIETLARITPPELTRTFLLSSGTEAMDGAIKLAHRATGRARYVSTEGSFHGRSLGALAVIGQAHHRAPYEALLKQGNAVVPFNDVDAARAAIDDETAAFIVEPVQGEGGVNPVALGYLAAVQEACREHGALLILDEIQTGIGRTGKMFALEHDDVVPDVLAIGKMLGGGVPIAGFLCTEAVAATVQAGDQGGTYAGNVLTCAAANAVIRVIEEDKLVERAASLGEALLTKLSTFAREHPDACEVARGRGLLCGLVLKDAELAGRVQSTAIERGVLVNVAGGNVLRFFPALNIPADDLWSSLDLLLELVAAG
ncbi:MAG: aspartate aminotransferase family protein [Deltaproteobacteria bacterium]|nr:aspartate aminotransferase family protein [Deltaproteobacteria bacterium]MBW2447902.1 aspartate aminotransferase family protein [Deltaproteobacteria bacterium]